MELKTLILGALLNNGKIQTLTLPDSFVGDSTKNYGIFPTLDYLLLPKNVKGFTKHAYFQVKEIEVDSDNPYFKSINNEYILSKDGKELYWAKSSLAEVNIPDTVEVIKSHAFYYSKTQEIRLPNKVKKIEYSIVGFSNVRKIEIPSSIQEINTSAFFEANALEEVVIHKKKDTIAGSPWGNPYGDRAIIWDE